MTILTTSVDDLFDSLRREDSASPTRRAFVHENPRLTDFLLKYDEAVTCILDLKRNGHLPQYTDMAETCRELVPRDYTPEELRQAWPLLFQFHEDHYRWMMAGHYITQAVNHMNGESVDLCSTPSPSYYLGSFLARNSIIFHGNCGPESGASMLGGRLHIIGNSTGIGRGMKRGEIIVDGNTRIPGIDSVGGEIYVNGEIIPYDFPLEQMVHSYYHFGKSARIFLKGKLIIENAEWVR